MLFLEYEHKLRGSEDEKLDSILDECKEEIKNAVKFSESLESNLNSENVIYSEYV